MEEYASVSDAIEALIALWPHLAIIRTEDHIVIQNGDRILFDGPDWGLLFFVEGLRAQIEVQAEPPPAYRSTVPENGDGLHDKK